MCDVKVPTYCSEDVDRCWSGRNDLSSVWRAAAASTRRAGRPQLNCPCRGEQQAALKSQHTEWKTLASGHDFQNKIQLERAPPPPIFTHPEERFWPLHPTCSRSMRGNLICIRITVQVSAVLKLLYFLFLSESNNISLPSLLKVYYTVLGSKQTKQTLWLCLWYMMNFGVNLILTVIWQEEEFIDFIIKQNIQMHEPKQENKGRKWLKHKE